MPRQGSQPVTPEPTTPFMSAPPTVNVSLSNISSAGSTNPVINSVTAAALTKSLTSVKANQAVAHAPGSLNPATAPVAPAASQGKKRKAPRGGGRGSKAAQAAEQGQGHILVKF